MKNQMILLFLGIIAVALMSCKMETLPVGGVDIEFDQTEDVPDTESRATFTKVVEDSRCPTNVDCIWAGQVTVEVEFEWDDKNEVKEMTIKGDDSELPSVIIDGTKIVLERVSPYPETPGEINDRAYSITLRVQ